MPTKNPGESGQRRAPSRDPLALLQVIDRLEIGPARVEPQRVTMPYTVVRGKDSDTTELIYRFEEDVFTPGEAASENLAAMIGAQVALNYGLFCSRLVFRGAFDETDRAFLAAAAENTAREIYVNKFLLPNEFLVGDAAKVPALRRETYGRARLEFPDLVEGASPGPVWSDEPSRHAVLSSGGKDSLLTFGLLRELGRDTHAIFINESGRHWYTALNAYRHFAAQVPGTGRVWTNSDRLFSWMLRHLPFVREDFARVRADEYPIRLWTVAVFLFGALPLLRKRGIGRLLIGNEFDTTVRPSHHGIPHYAGLYDQSRYFDNVLTRYFKRKGWGVLQFSILRPLSELLIETVLAQRYPDLQALQVSCHAAHLEDERVRPCGRCEKCRRIVGMLTAIGADPRRCGYDDAQIAACLAAVREKGVHQETAGAARLQYLLQRSAAADDAAAPDAGEGPHPEVQRLRFDNAHAPWDTFPPDLREGLYGIFLQHAEGAVERKGRVWIECDPLSEEALSVPYRLDSPSGSKDRDVARLLRRTAARPHLLAELSWPQARERFREVDVALLPVGATEQHGPHLPLDTDSYDADQLCRRVAEACSAPRPLVLPLIPYGVSYHHETFSGTLSVNPDTLARFVFEVGVCAAQNGVTKLVIVNGHGGNAASLHLAAQMINKDTHIFTCVDTGETSDTDIYSIVDGHNDVHAGEIETSTSLATRPELVDMERAPRTVPRFSSAFLDFTSKRSVGWYARTEKISDTGVMGDATKATREKGEKIWELMTSRLVELVEELKRLSLDEIYQKRY